MNIILASASPRRKALLEQVGIFPHIQASSFVELEQSSLSPKLLVEQNACGKALAVAKECLPNDVVIAADTVVVLEGLVLGKPCDALAARKMLSALSGKTHEVLTGVSVVYQGREFYALEKTLVSMRDLTVTEIESYVVTGEPLDKAGAYGIQGKGALLVKKIDGCYYNVVGLPLVCLFKLFKEAGINFEY